MIKIHCSYDRMVPISEIKLNPKNRNKHPKDQIDRIVKVMKYNGIRRCITVSNRSGVLSVGEGRYLAMKQLGIKEVPVNFQDYDNEEAEYADGVADNALGHWSDLDRAGINSDIIDLGPDFDIDLLGLKDFKLDPEEHDFKLEKIDLQPQFIVAIQCKSEDEMSVLFEEMAARGFECKLIT